VTIPEAGNTTIARFDRERMTRGRGIDDEDLPRDLE
jgi:hypothetical protein